jgi:hypothetical protein
MKACPFIPLDLEKLWIESEQRGLPKFSGGTPITPNFKAIKQYTRLTLICDDPKVVHQIMVSPPFVITCKNLTSCEAKKTSVVNTFDIFAVRTSESEQIFDQCCTKSDVDVISLNLGGRMNYFLNKTLIK